MKITDLQDAEKLWVRQSVGELNFAWWNWDELYKIKGSPDSYWLAPWFAYLEPIKYIDCFKKTPFIFKIDIPSLSKHKRNLILT